MNATYSETIYNATETINPESFTADRYAINQFRHLFSDMEASGQPALNRLFAILVKCSQPCLSTYASLALALKMLAETSNLRHEYESLLDDLTIHAMNTLTEDDQAYYIEAIVM